ncbi:MAG: hypothetical protein K2R98_20445 [Gemmataceae bacterium]|nr:hypothetical protein [Gemmataceae bacterium]
MAQGNVIDCSQVPVFRGAGTKVARPNVDIKIDRQTGLVKPDRSGLSVHVDRQKLIDGFGTAPRIKSIPDELHIVQQGKDPGHYAISPKEAMTPEHFQELLDQVEFEP